MSRVIVSPKYQVVIDKDVRDEVPVTVGQEMEVIAKNGVVVLVPVRAHEELRGMSAARVRDKRDRR